MPLAILMLLVVASLGSAGLTFALTILYLRSREGHLDGASPNDLRLLQNEVQRLAEEFDRTTGEMEQLRERLDFTERLLGSGEDEPA